MDIHLYTVLDFLISINVRLRLKTCLPKTFVRKNFKMETMFYLYEPITKTNYRF